MFELAFTITNLTCDACVKVSTSALRKLSGVTDVSVDLKTGAGRLVSSELIQPQTVTELLKTKGYTVVF